MDRMFRSRTLRKGIKEAKSAWLRSKEESCRYKSTNASSGIESLSRSYVEKWLGNDLKGSSEVNKPHYINSNRQTTPDNNNNGVQSFAMKITSLQRRIKELETQLTSSSSSSSSSSISSHTPSDNSTMIAPTAMIHYGTVRSGQQVYAEGRSLIVIGSVNSGGELMADGDIHVYGKLEGRAICGLSGCKSASIFTQNFDASLVGVGNTFIMCDDHTKELENTFTGKAVYVQLMDRGASKSTSDRTSTKACVNIEVDDESIMISLI